MLSVANAFPLAEHYLDFRSIGRTELPTILACLSARWLYVGSVTSVIESVVLFGEYRMSAAIFALTVGALTKLLFALFSTVSSATHFTLPELRALMRQRLS